jgi:hypothetical protein
VSKQRDVFCWWEPEWRWRLMMLQGYGRIRLAWQWLAAGCAVVIGGILVIWLFDRIGLTWSCGMRLGVLGTVLAWIAVAHHVLSLMWILAVVSYPRRYFGRRERMLTSLLLGAYMVVVLWVVATSC